MKSQETKRIIYPLVSIDTMNTQINIRIPEKLLILAKSYAQKNGFGTLQEFIKETLREKLFAPEISKKELALVKKLVKISETNNLYGSEKELFEKLRRKQT